MQPPCTPVAISGASPIPLLGALLLALALILALAPQPARAAFPLTVVNAPVTPVEGQQFSGIAATVGDPNGVKLASEYSASIEWGDGTTDTATVVVSGGIVYILARTSTRRPARCPSR